MTDANPFSTRKHERKRLERFGNGQLLDRFDSHTVPSKRRTDRMAISPTSKGLSSMCQPVRGQKVAPTYAVFKRVNWQAEAGSDGHGH